MSDFQGSDRIMAIPTSDNFLSECNTKDSDESPSDPITFRQDPTVGLLVLSVNVVV